MCVHSSAIDSLNRSCAGVAPLGGAEELFVQQLARCLRSEPQTLGKAVLYPYKAAIYPLPSSSPAACPPFSDLRDICREKAEAARPSLLGTGLVVSTCTLQDSGPSPCSPETDG